MAALMEEFQPSPSRRWSGMRRSYWQADIHRGNEVDGRQEIADMRGAIG
ncbi:hypothetical protein [Bradyrhizobium forestalis]|nr:hypothetical protein [Bradyrhizobium forestalis]